MHLPLWLIVAGLLLLAGSLATAQRNWREPPADGGFYDQQERDEYDREWRAPGFARKICSVYVPNVFRDTIGVPNTWQKEDCRDYAKSIRATHMRLGCVFSRGERKIAFGSEQGGAPERNCGW